MTREQMDRMYDSVLADLKRGEPVAIDEVADLEAAGYVFPRLDDEDDGDNGLSPNEVTVSFTDYNHDTTVDVLVDLDGDIQLGSPDTEGSILLSPTGAKRLLEILAEVLDYELVD